MFVSRVGQEAHARALPLEILDMVTNQDKSLTNMQVGCPPGRMRCPGAMSAFWPPRASSLSRSSSPAKPSRTRCLRSFEMDAMLAFLACAFSFSRSACTCFEYFFASRCFRLAAQKNLERRVFLGFAHAQGSLCSTLLPHVQIRRAPALGRNEIAICFGMLVLHIHGHGSSSQT